MINHNAQQFKIDSTETLEKILNKAQLWHDSKLEECEAAQISLFFTLINIGYTCDKLCNLIRTKETRDSQQLTDWLKKKSQAELKAAESIITPKFLEHKYKSYRYSAKSDKEIGDIENRRGNLRDAITYYESSIDKYVNSIIASEEIANIKISNYRFDRQKANENIKNTSYCISQILLELFEITHDQDYLDMAKSTDKYTREISKKFKLEDIKYNIITSKIIRAEEMIRTNFSII